MQSRRKAFSHKQKKQQLRERRERHGTRQLARCGIGSRAPLAARSTEEPVDDITNVVRGRAQPPAEKKCASFPCRSNADSHGALAET